MSAKQVVVRPGGTVRRLGANGTAIGAAGGLAIASCPSGKLWELCFVSIELVASATVGNRQLVTKITVDNSTTDWIGATSGNVAAAQIGGYDVAFGAPLGTPSTTVRRALVAAANTNVQVRETSGLRFIKASGNIIIDDIADIDNADTINWRLQVIEYEA